MDASELYDTDFVLWTEQQAAALRQLRGVSNSLDIEHLAGEIEDLGKRDVREVASYLRLILLHGLKIAFDPDDLAVRHWRGEIIALQQNALAAFAPSMRQLIDLDEQWVAALSVLAASWSKPSRSRLLAAAKEVGCPVGLDQLLAADLDLDVFLDRVANSLSEFRPEPPAA